MKKIAAIDVGLKRVGIALYLSGVVLPQNAIIRKNRVQASRDLRNFLDEWDIDILVVGIPKGGSSEEEMKRRIEHFVSLIDFDKEIFYQDESFSSHEAKELLKGEIKQKRDGRIDSLAAKIILQRWISENSI